MKIELIAEDISRFDRTGAIEFHGILSQSERAALVKALEAELEKRLRAGLGTNFLGKREVFARDLIQYGRDMALSSETIRSILFQRKFAEAASLLIHKKPLRWGFDQLIAEDSFFKAIDGPLDIQKNISVSDILICGAIVCSAPAGGSLDEWSARVFYFKPLIGSPDSTPSRFFDLKKDDGRCDWVLLFGYTGMRPVYLALNEDPQLHGLKKYGYGFGDRLSQTTHPVVLR